MVIASFGQGGRFAAVHHSLYQYDYGQVLRIQGLNLPSAVEIHFSLQKTGGESVTRVGMTKDGVTDVLIPDSMLENSDTISNYTIYAFIYLTDESSGQTEYRIELSITARPKPEAFDHPEDAELFREAIKAVNDSADRAEESEKQAEGWAHGREDLPERAEDNAKYYAEQTAQDALQTEADRRETDRLVQSISGIEGEVAKDLEQVKEFAGQAQTSATNAALSERAAEEAKAGAETARAGAETAEGNAELAEQHAKASEATVEKAKEIVQQLGQEVLDNKNAVDKTAENFADTVKTATEELETAKTQAIESVNIVGTEVVEAVQKEGTDQTGMVTAEGEKQVQAIHEAAQEIVADRDQIQKNKYEIDKLGYEKADAVITNAGGENIVLTNSDDTPFKAFNLYGKSTQDGIPSIESPVPIVSIGESGQIDVRVYGRQLFNIDECNLTPNIGAKSKDGWISQTIPLLNDQAFYNYSQPSADRIVVGKTYTLVAEVEKIPKGMELFILGLGSNIADNQFNDTYTVNTAGIHKKSFVAKRNKTETKNMLMSFLSVRGGLSGDIKFRLSVYEGDLVQSLPDYEPYKRPQSLTIPTPNGLPGIPVMANGNYTDENGQQWVCDEIDLERGKYVQRVKEYVPSEKRNLIYLTDGGVTDAKTIMVRYNSKEKNILKHNTMSTFSNKVESNIWLSDKECFNHAIDGYIDFRINKNRLASVDTDCVIEVCDKINAKIVYALETPIEHDLPPELIEAYKQLQTNYPTTTVSNDAGAGMKVIYVADTKNYITEYTKPLQEQITALQNTLVNLKVSGGA